MKTIRILSKLIAVAAIFAMVLSFASCFGGALKLESFTVDRSSVKTNYLVGEEVDFSGIKAVAKYSDPSLNKTYTYEELTLTYPEDITATEGTKEVTVSFDDPNLNVKQETKFTVTVKEESSSEPVDLIGFARPESINAFYNANSNAGKSNYGDGTFSSEFVLGEKTYVIGDDNPFIFLPLADVFGEDGPERLSAVNTVVELFIEKDGEFVALTATKGDGNLVSFHDGETLIATVDTYACSYQFTADAVGSKIKISAAPSPEHYTNASEYNAIELEANIVDAYNIFEAWELAVIDSDHTDNRGYASFDSHIWDDFKTEHGISDIYVTGVVLHNDLKVTANDVPDAFFFTTTEEVVYTNSVTGETTTIPAGTKYLKDWSEIYLHRMPNGEKFLFEGNFFTIDASEFPIIASPAVFDIEGDADDYGSSFSNATLIKFISTYIDGVENYASVDMVNLSIKGNAARNNLVDSEGSLVSAGGIIFIKMNECINATLDNIIGNSFFITYFPEWHIFMDITNMKCYDSYQNTAFVYGDCTLTIKDSFINGTGGPVIICSGDKENEINHRPIAITENTIIDTHLSGNEIWFAATGSTGIVGQIKALSQGLQAPAPYGLGVGSFVDSNDQMTIYGFIMSDRATPNEIIGNVGANGHISIDGKGLARLPDNTTWQKFNLAFQANNALATAPFLTVQDAEGNDHTIIYAGEKVGFLHLNDIDLSDPSQYPALLTPFNPDPTTDGGSMEHYATYLAFQQADTITLTMGGLTAVFEFYH